MVLGRGQQIQCFSVAPGSMEVITLMKRSLEKMRLPVVKICILLKFNAFFRAGLHGKMPMLSLNVLYTHKCVSMCKPGPEEETFSK